MEKIAVGLYEQMGFRWVKMSRCTRKESYVIVSSLAKMWKLRRRRKRSLKGKRLLNLRKKEVKLRVKGYNKARYVPSANMSSRAGQMQ